MATGSMSVTPEEGDQDALALMRGGRANVVPRRAVRRLCAIKAEIWTDDGRRADCTIRDVSASGAKLGLSPAFALPHDFSLMITGRERSVRVYLAWRSGSYAGVTIAKPTTR